MTTVLIVLLLVVGLLAAASLALGRATYEVDSARDTEYLELEGAWVRYNVIGAGPPVLLVHGWLSSSRVWERLAQRLAQRYTVYTLDLKGFGESDKPLTGYGVRYGSRLLYAFCAHFGLTRTAVIAHDLGGDMAVKLAADHPDIVGRLVLVSVPADEDQIDLPTALWLATLPVVGPLFYALGRAAPVVRGMWMKPFVLDQNDLTEETIEDAGKSTPAAVAKTLGVTRREISRERLARQARIIKVPVLLVAGEDDQIVDPQSVSVWARTIGQAEIRLLDACGHLPMIERPGEFNAQMLAFLTGDHRYLETTGEPRVEEPSSSEEGPNITDLGVGAAGAQGVGGAPQPPDAAEDETAELIPPDEEPAGGEELPGRAGQYPPSDQRAVDEEPVNEPPLEPSAEPSAKPPAFGDNGESEEQRRPFADEEPDLQDYPELPDRESEGRSGRRASGGDEDADGPNRSPMPEIPDDLFKWPEAWEEFRPREGSEERQRERRRRRSGADDEDDSLS